MPGDAPPPPVGQPGFGTPYLGHGFRRPNFVPKFGASVRSSYPTGEDKKETPGGVSFLVYFSSGSQRLSKP